MDTIPLAKASLALPFIKFLDQIGAPTERYLEQVHLPIDAFYNLNTLVPLHQGCAFLELAAQKEGLEDLAIWVGQQTQIPQLGSVWPLLDQSLTLYDLLHKILQFRKTWNSGAKVWLTEMGDHQWLHHQFLLPQQFQTGQANYYTISNYLNLIRLVSGSEWQPEQLYIRSGISKAILEVDYLSNTPIQFNQSSNAICFSKALLSKPLTLPSTAFTANNLAESLLSTVPADGFQASLEQLIQSLLPRKYPSLAIAAAAAGVSIRTLQRRLKEHQLNYSQLIEKIRFNQAVKLLQDPTTQLIDIAFELGYTDAANFTRAFKRWTGVSPREFRRLHLRR
ncbi:MAG: helix-turn-helix domain-containing protein [Leptolyngbyaceae cyanobacterium bins.349]|nr:helix-turn-helix domain-containing protein [Leptolyngbyaceae cyanobacterium bins.349]